MRTGLSTIQQTLTPEAATVLNQAISEAGRRNHGQTTPLHVAATLLASPSGFLRLACIRSHPNSSHPLQCRALELCFSVALDRLPASSQKEQHQPPISNALMAALKRSQAHQRRGCPEQQQQPLLAVKVELEQLIISILDDPSVSRVMREASFSSPAVKNAIEQSLSSCSSSSQIAPNPSLIGLGFRPVPNQYLNPRLQQPQVGRKCDEVKQVVEILMRSRRRNPVLVGDSEAEAVMKELLRRIANKELVEGILRNVDVISFDPHSSSSRIKELGEKIENRMGFSDGVVVDLGDLKWVVEQPAGGLQPEAGRAGVVEMGKLLAQFREGFPGRVWLISRASCETYMRCQVYHRSMENDWDLQAVPIAAKAPPLPPLSNPRLSMSNGSIRGSSIDNICSSKNVLPGQALNSIRSTHCCPDCRKSCEEEIAKLAEVELSSSSSGIMKAESAITTLPELPKWLQNAAHVKSSDHSQGKDEQVLQKKWANACLLRHPQFHQTQVAPMLNLYNSDIIAVQPRLQTVPKSIGENLRLNLNPEEEDESKGIDVSTSPVRTDLALGSLKTTTRNESERSQRLRLENDRLGCISSNGFHSPQVQKGLLTDADLFKKLLKGLMQKVGWQQEAVSSVVAAVSRCRSGLARTRYGAPKGDLWLMFTGPDRVGKTKMARVLSDLVCGGTDPVTFSLGFRRDENTNFRGKTVLDRIAEAVKRNPFSLIVLEDVDEVDAVICGNIRKAMEKGRLIDSHNREISLGNVIFILTAKSLPQNNAITNNDIMSNNPITNKATAMDEEKLRTVACGGWQLRLSACDNTGKRQANRLCKEDRQPHAKPRTEIPTASSLSFDLNLAAEEDGNDESRNSSGPTMDHEDEHCKKARGSLIARASSSSQQLLDSIDDAVIFKAVDFDPIRRSISTSIAARFSGVIGKQGLIEVDDEALEKILGGVWFGEMELGQWEEKVLVPSFRSLKAQLPSCPLTNLLVRLEPGEDSDSDCRSSGNWLPDKIRVAVDELEL